MKGVVNLFLGLQDIVWTEELVGIYLTGSRHHISFDLLLDDIKSLNSYAKSFKNASSFPDSYTAHIA